MENTSGHDTPLCYTVAEAAVLLRVSEKSVRLAVKRGDLPTVPYFGDRVLIPALALARLVNGEAA